MRKLIPVICLVLGAVLVVSAAAFWGFDYVKTSNIGKNAEIAVEKVLSQIPVTHPRVPEERGNNKMASMNVDGVNVVGVLEFPRYGRKLAVLSGWDKDAVSFVPCRYSGSIYDRSLVIGAGDREGQLDFADTLDAGERFTLTDMEGGVYTYQIQAIQHSKTADPAKLQSEEYDLTVFLKDNSTGQYLLIRCKAI